MVVRVVRLLVIPVHWLLGTCSACPLAWALAFIALHWVFPGWGLALNHACFAFDYSET